MKKLQDYLTESEHWMESPSTGDHFDIELADDTLLETYVMGVDSEGGILLDSNQDIYSLLESWNMLEDDIDTDVEEDIDSDVNQHRTSSTRSTNDLEEMAPLAAMVGGALARAVGSAVHNNRNNDTNENQDPGEYDQEGDMAKNELLTIIRAARKLSGMLDDDDNMPEWTQKKITKASDYVDTAADYISSQKERGIMEDNAVPTPVARAILHRIMMSHPGMISQYGPEQVMNAVDDVAEYIGDVEEIGTSDVSEYVRAVQQMLGGIRESGVAEGSDKDNEDNNEPELKQTRAENEFARTAKQASKDFNKWAQDEHKKPGVAEGSLNEAATMASVSKLLRHIERHHPNWFDDYGMGEVEDAVVDMAEQGTFSGMTVVDAAALVGQELESLYGADGMNEGSADLTDIWQAGREAAYSGKSMMSCPHKMFSKEWDAWQQGWQDQKGSTSDGMNEAEYQGRKVQLNKKMSNTDGKSKSKVYVRDPKTGNVKKVTFGDPNMKIRKSNPGARKSFRARHNCANPGPKTKARYWSCRSW